MGAIKIDPKSGSVEITYGGREAPFGGLDASAPDPYITPNSITKESFGVLALNNTLTAIALPGNSNSNFPFGISLSATQIYLGSGDLQGVWFIAIYDSSDNTLGIWYDTSPDTIIVGANAYISLALPNMAYTPFPEVGSLTYKNVNGVCYLSFKYCPYIIQFNGTSLSLLTDYLGCGYLNELNGRLIGADVFQIAQAVPNTSSASTPANSTISVTGPVFDYTTANGTNMVLPSVAVGAGAAASLQIAFNYTISSSFPGGDNPNSYYGTVDIEVSIDSGSSWTTIYSYKSGTYGTPTTGQNLTYYLSGVTNLNTVAVRAVVGSSNADLPNIINSQCSITSVLGNVVNAPVPPVYAEYPYQFAWSAGEEQYWQWNTLNSSGFVSGAGYNNLPDIEDSITGMFMVGPTCYLLRSQGITEVSPLNSGIQPFDFNHLWASHQGIGTVYPLATGQYGALGTLIANDDVYSIGYEGINVISGTAKAAIFADLAASGGSVVGGSAYLNIDGDVSVVYIFAIQAANPATENSTVYIYYATKGIWFKFYILAGYYPVSVNAYNWITGTQRSQTVNGMAISVLDAAKTKVNFISLPVDSLFSQDLDFNIVFPAEELMFERDVTIDGIGVYVFISIGSSAVNFPITFTINGLSYTTLDDTIYQYNGGWQYLKLYPIDGTYTGNSPQLTVAGSYTDSYPAQFKIGKIVLFGSIDTSQRPM